MKGLMGPGFGVTTAIAAVCLVGCGAEPGSVAGDTASAPTAEMRVAGQAPAARPAALAPEKAEGNLRTVSLLPRRIIYNAEVELIAPDLTAAEKDLLQLVERSGGYVAQKEVGGEAGATREGRWTVRVPADGFDNFLDAASRLGELQKVHTDSQDVSEEFYDLEARLKNKQVEEQRLLRHLERSTARLQDILAVERELSRVRGEIEQMQGRLRLLANLTEMSTVTVTIREVREFIAPRPTTFAAQVARTFASSAAALRDFSKSVVLAVVAVLPWLGIAGLFAAAGGLLVRRFRTRPTS